MLPCKCAFIVTIDNGCHWFLCGVSRGLLIVRNILGISEIVDRGCDFVVGYQEYGVADGDAHNGRHCRQAVDARYSMAMNDLVNDKYKFF